MLTLFGNAFSPFSRKVQLVLEYKGVDYEMVDGLSHANHDRLAEVNQRLEVPAIDHDGLIVVNSADIVAYLERVFADRPLYPSDHESWVKARAWERCADTVIDPILVDISYWVWAIREDKMPAGLLDAARADLATIYEALDQQLEGRDWVCGELSIADIALFPHLSGTRMLQVPFDQSRYGNLFAWYKRCRAAQIFADDLARTKAYLAEPASMDIEREKIFWRGDRIEWILARGYHEWFVNEIEEGRVLWPKLGIPASTKKMGGAGRG
ncbi:MAG: glutathione S-transferase family protein [Deltaproteobacteria bacterium]|jgi:glutathione S-transferase|nr:glutathione S-transferase family protein [Deltaproteobacteria bacterium]